MDWKKLDRYSEESIDGRYRVCAVKMGEGWRMEAWSVPRDYRGKPAQDEQQLLGGFSNGGLARECCERHKAKIANAA